MTMIDEEWLVEALRDLGSVIEVPSDGPARVLAARPRVVANAVPRPGRRSPRRRQLVVVAVALAAVGVLGVGLALSHASAPVTSTASAPAVGHGADGKQALPNQAALGTAGPTAPEASAPASNAGAGAAPATVPALATKVIKTGTVQLQVGKGKLSSAVDQLTSLAGGLGGYVANAQTTEGGGAPTGDLTLRVPVGQFETLLDRTRTMGKPLAVSTSGQDVTASYVDLDARIQALQDTRAQYLQILSKATSIGDVLSVEQQLSDLQTQIEQLQGQEMVLADQTSFSTLTVHLSEPGPSAGSLPASPGGLARAWDHARSSFTHAVEAVIGASGGVAVFLVCAGLVLLVGRLLWPVIRRRLV